MGDTDAPKLLDVCEIRGNGRPARFRSDNTGEIRTRAERLPPAQAKSLLAEGCRHDDRLQRLFWWADSASFPPERVAAQVMVMGDLQDIMATRRRFGAGIFAKVLASPPRGLFDIKSWTYWHKKLGHKIIPPLPPQPAPWPPR